MNIVPRRFYLEDFFNDFLPSTNNHMKCDIYEKDGNYHIEMDIPGFDKNDIAIEVKNGYLIVSAEKEEENKEEDKSYIHRERTYGKFERSFYVGDVNSDEIKAKFEHGTLKIYIPKEKLAENKKMIEIEE